MNKYILFTKDHEYIIETNDFDLAQKMLVATQDPDAYILDFVTGERIT